jgi:putative colanic acid biosynthesis acetyltransferase WcaF
MPQYQDLSIPHNTRSVRANMKIQLWYIVNATLFGCSPHVFYGWRRFLLRLFGARIGSNVKIRPSCKIAQPWNLSIGNHSYIGDEVVLYSLDRIEIGQHVSVSARSYLCTGTHNPRSIKFDLITAPILIEDESWIAADSFIYPGITIGLGAVIAARSTVRSNLLPGYIYAGTPAVAIKSRMPQ